jgi:MFS family permease
MSIKPLWSAVLCGYLALGATIQALPGLRLGGVATTGALVTASAFATAATRPFAGRWADRGAPVASVGAALVALGTAAHLVARSVPEMGSRGWCSARARARCSPARWRSCCATRRPRAAGA